MKWSTWNPFRPFGREQSEVERALTEVLDGVIDPREWGNFLDIPMKGTPSLEAIRKRCVALASEESMDAHGKIVYTPEAREVLASLRDQLRCRT